MRTIRHFTLLAPVLASTLGLLSACPGRDVSAVDPNQSKEEQKEIPVSVNRDIDILWVIDNSGSMEQEQVSLANNFPKFIEVLNGIEGGLPNIHMAIVSSDMGTPGYNVDKKCEPDGGDNGVFQVLSECPGLTDSNRFIRDVVVGEEGARERNYDGDLAAQFSCMAQLGIEGCGFEAHLEAMRSALDNTQENGGFLRDNAFLAVIFIQDEDDCSPSNPEVFSGTEDDDRASEFGEYASYRCFEYGTACEPSDDRVVGPRDNCVPDDNSAYIEKVSTYVDYLKGVKDDPSKVIVAEITGPTDPVTVSEDPDNNDQLAVEPACVVCPGGGTDCDVSFGSGGDALVGAAPAIRMQAFLEGFPQRSTFQNICAYNPDISDVDLSGGLTQIALLLKTVIGNPCISGELADSNPGVDGVQPECKVADVQNLNLENQEETLIPSCDDAGPPCYRFLQDDTCDTESNLALEVDRGGDEAPPETTVVVRCLVN